MQGVYWREGQGRDALGVSTGARDLHSLLGKGYNRVGKKVELGSNDLGRR